VTVGVLQRFEERLEHLVTGAFARTFRSAVQPVEIAAALQREVDNSAQIMSRDRRLAPNDFTIDLSPADYGRLSAFGQTLSQELATMLHQHASEQGYRFAGPLRLTFRQAEDLTTGRFRVQSEAAAQVTGTPADTEHGGGRDSGVRLDINGTIHPLRSSGMVVGRGTGVDVRIDDPGVSRRHAEFRFQPGADGQPTVSVLDLGSTNGTAVNGQRIQQAVLRPGDVIQVGGTKIRVFRASDQPSTGGSDVRGAPPSRPGLGGPDLGGAASSGRRVR
jgi:pSer/pThr/pTyr-binding forkhead associated (FHA) protein